MVSVENQFGNVLQTTNQYLTADQHTILTTNLYTLKFGTASVEK